MVASTAPVASGSSSANTWAPSPIAIGGPNGLAAVGSTSMTQTVPGSCISAARWVRGFHRNHGDACATSVDATGAPVTLSSRTSAPSLRPASTWVSSTTATLPNQSLGLLMRTSAWPSVRCTTIAPVAVTHAIVVPSGDSAPVDAETSS